MAREHFGLSELEKTTQAGGSLSVHIGDALSESATVQGGFAGNHLMLLKHIFKLSCFLNLFWHRMIILLVGQFG